MGFSEIPPPAESTPGADPPSMRVRPPGPQSRTWLTRHRHRAAPMGPAVPEGQRPWGIVYATAKGSNVVDVDSNRYVDLVAGFGALLLGHDHPHVRRVIGLQADRMLHALGDVYPADAKVAFLERVCSLHPDASAQAILAQSGSEAVAAALKTAKLATGRGGVIAFDGAYHGLGYGPLAACGLRESYRKPFESELNPAVTFVGYPTGEDASEALRQVEATTASGTIGAILVEPVLGRGGVRVPPAGFLPGLEAIARRSGALLVCDEIWTGLGRSGAMLYSVQAGCCPDVVCLGKGLGGGLPISACIAPAAIMNAWSRADECVHTSTFAGAPLACATGIATLDVLSREGLVSRSKEVGARWLASLREMSSELPRITDVRGSGLMIAVDLGGEPGIASRAQKHLLEAGYLVSTGGGQRETLVLTPPLNVSEDLLNGFVPVAARAIARLGRP